MGKVVEMSEPKEAEAKPASDKRLEKEIAEIVAGKRKPPTEVMAYIVEKLEDSRIETRLVIENIQKLEAQLDKNKQRGLELQGICREYVQNLRELYAVLETEKTDD